MRHFLIDTDTASDDAVALIMAAKYQPKINIEAITIVAGNVPVDQGVQNALYTMEICNRTVPIYKGANQPILRPLNTAQHIHGEDGMGDIGLDLKGRKASNGNAIDAIINTIKSYPYEIELVTLGPLTNIAIAILKEPSIAKQVKVCTIMGGIGQGYGNITPVAEYNIWADPEAAKIVFSSDMKIRMVGWDISRTYAFFDSEAIAEVQKINTPLAHFSIDIQKTLNHFAIEKSKLSGFDLPDPIAMAIALDPEIIITSENVNVEVIIAEGSTRGQTVVDHNRIVDASKPVVEVVLSASRENFLKTLHNSLK